MHTCIGQAQIIIRFFRHVSAVPVYEVGDVVASCDFDNSDDSDGLTTGCDGFDPEYGNMGFNFASASDSADTGPTADHTGDGGKYYVGSASTYKAKYFVVWLLSISDRLPS